MSEKSEDISQQLNRQTAKISWQELQRFYAAGNVVAVAPGNDLIEVAVALHSDNLQQLKTWMDQGRVFKVDDQTALHWVETQAVHWAVVVAPFVVVQQVSEPT